VVWVNWLVQVGSRLVLVLWMVWWGLQKTARQSHLRPCLVNLCLVRLQCRVGGVYADGEACVGGCVLVSAERLGLGLGLGLGLRFGCVGFVGRDGLSAVCLMVQDGYGNVWRTAAADCRC